MTFIVEVIGVKDWRNLPTFSWFYGPPTESVHRKLTGQVVCS